LIRTKVKEVGIDVALRHVLWAKDQPNYEPFFSNLDGLRLDGEWRYWIDHSGTEGKICHIEIDNGQMRADIEIQQTMSHNPLTRAEEYKQ